jgi:hypothetical protein
MVFLVLKETLNHIDLPNWAMNFILEAWSKAAMHHAQHSGFWNSEIEVGL